MKEQAKFMTKEWIRRFSQAAVLAVFAGFTQSCSVINRAKDPAVVIVVPPEDQEVEIGSRATFSVVARHGPSNNAKGLTYQWQKNSTPFISEKSQTWMDIRGATQPTYTIPNTQISSVGHYRVKVTGSPTETSGPASLAASAAGAGGAITVFGPPLATSGNSTSPNGCPGRYLGSVTYKRTVAKGWGWGKLPPGPFRASDGTTRTDTKLELSGFSGDRQCDSTGVSRTNLANSKYRFTIYFPQNVPMTNAYPIVLNRFK